MGTLVLGTPAYVLDALAYGWGTLVYALDECWEKLVLVALAYVLDALAYVQGALAYVQGAQAYVQGTLAYGWGTLAYGWGTLVCKSACVLAYASDG